MDKNLDEKEDKLKEVQYVCICMYISIMIVKITIIINFKNKINQ